MKLLKRFFFILLLVYSGSHSEQIQVEFAGRVTGKKVAPEKYVTYWSDSVSIKLIKKNIKITSQKAKQNDLTETIQFNQGVHVVDSSSSLRCDSIYYFFEMNKLRAMGNINYILEKDSLHIACDSAEYFYDKNECRLFHNFVTYYKSYIIKGDSAYCFPDEDSLLIFGDCRLSKDSLSVKAQLITVNRKESEIHLNGSPEMKHEKSFLSGEEMVIHIREEKVDSIDVVNYARGRLLEIDTLLNDTTITHISGRSIKVGLWENEINDFNIFKNARVEYEYWNEKEKEKGRNILYGYKIEVGFRKNEISRIKVIDGVEGEYQRTTHPKEEEKKNGDSKGGKTGQDLRKTNSSQ